MTLHLPISSLALQPLASSKLADSLLSLLRFSRLAHSTLCISLRPTCTPLHHTYLISILQSGMEDAFAGLEAFSDDEEVSAQDARAERIAAARKAAQTYSAKIEEPQVRVWLVLLLLSLADLFSCSGFSLLICTRAQRDLLRDMIYSSCINCTSTASSQQLWRRP